MNDLSIGLIWSALQVTLLTLAAAGVYALVGAATTGNGRLGRHAWSCGVHGPDNIGVLSATGVVDVACIIARSRRRPKRPRRIDCVGRKKRRSSFGFSGAGDCQGRAVHCKAMAIDFAARESAAALLEFDDAASDFFRNRHLGTGLAWSGSSFAACSVAPKPANHTNSLVGCFSNPEG